MWKPSNFYFLRVIFWSGVTYIVWTAEKPDKGEKYAGSRSLINKSGNIRTTVRTIPDRQTPQSFDCHHLAGWDLSHKL